MIDVTYQLEISSGSQVSVNPQVTNSRIWENSQGDLFCATLLYRSVTPNVI